jgi:hypothetical protein
MVSGLKLGLLFNYGEALIKNGIHRIANNLSSYFLSPCLCVTIPGFPLLFQLPPESRRI